MATKCECGGEGHKQDGWCFEGLGADIIESKVRKRKSVCA
jgi:hypothetical protein